MSATVSPSSASFPAPSDWQVLRLLTFYRLILAGLLTVLYLSLQDSNPFNVEQNRLFTSTLLTYLAFSVAAGFATRLHWPNYQLQTLLQILADIGAVALLMHATGGANSSLSVLLVIAVAAGALIAPGRLGYLFAAVATLVVLAETGIASLSLDKTGADDITRAGLLGIVLFAAAALAQVLATRIRESEALAQQRGIDLANLEQLNEYIIQELQSGVLVIDPDGNIRLANDTARRLLGLDPQSGSHLNMVAPLLARQLEHWFRDRQWEPEPMQCHATGSRVIPRFSQLETARGRGALISLEDSAQLARQTQQIKLASLGRLTASIAHEIRNPLGAISHAAQLLAESETLESGDKRLTEIIGNHTLRVNAIIENILQLSRRDTSRPQQLAMREWLAQFHDDLVQTEGITPQQLRIQIGADDVSVQVDPGHLHQVLTNLCQNAFRHAGAGGEVTLTVTKDDSGMVQVDVIDRGPGIDQETADQVFEPFYTTASSGTGLGLYIARELCDINRARLSYLPAPGGGSCFRIQFTADPAD